MNLHRNKSIQYLQRGISVIEIMIALVIGMLVTLGAIQLFITNKQTYRIETELSRLQETGRFIVDTLAREVRMAGFNGCSSRGNIEPNVIAVDPPPFNANGEKAVQGFEATGTNSWTPTLPAQFNFPAPDDIDVRSGTDVFNIERADDCGAQVAGNYEPDNANVQVAFPNGCGFQKYQPVLITDCVGADIYAITNTPGGSGNKQTTAHAPGAAVNTDNRLSKAYGPDSSIFIYRSFSFYIAPSSQDASEPALWMANWVPDMGGTNDAADYQLLELGSGVEDMQVTYGIDNAAPDEYADTYMDAEAVETSSNWPNVRSVRINLLLRSRDGITEEPREITFNGATAGGADNRLRMVYTSTITLRNRLP